MNYSTATPRIAAYLLVRQAGKLAFVYRSNTDWMNDHYGLPSGKVEKNENYIAAAVREGFEEIGITIQSNDLIFTHVMHRFEGSDWVDVFFEVKKWHGIPRNNEPHMHSELVWLDPKKLPDNVIPSVKFAMEQIEAGKQFSQYGW